MADLYARVAGETLVNTLITGPQIEPRAVGLAGGGYVVVWTDQSGGTANQECRGQVFDNQGNPVGSEFLINADTSGNEFQPKVAALEGGGFVVSFTDSNGDAGTGTSGTTGIHVQRFDALGNKLGGEITANATIDASQVLSNVGGLAGGGFVAVWTDNSTGPGSSGDLKGRLFDADGDPGIEFAINVNTINSQRDAVVTGLANGNFVVAWGDAGGSDGSGYGIRARIFDTTGAAVTAELPVNTATSGNQGNPSITLLAGGGFVITWEDYSATGSDASQAGIKGQVFDANGVAIGGEFLVNTATLFLQEKPSVAALASGGFVIAWTDHSGIGGDTQDSGSHAIKAQVFNADGTRDGIEFLVNTTTAQNQWMPTVAGLSNGGFAVSWVDASGANDNNGFGVVTQVFAPSDGTIGDIALSNAAVSETQAENTIVGTLSADGPVTVARDLTYTIVADSTGGAFGIKDDKLIVADNDRLDFETATSASVTIAVTDGDGNTYQETFAIAVTDVADEARWHAGNDIVVNTTIPGDQSMQAMAALVGGGYVITWTDASATGGDTSGAAIRGQRFDNAGNKVGGEFLVNTTTTNAQTASSVVGTEDGGFLVVWQDGSVSPSAIRGQFFDADGDRDGLELQIDDGVGAATLPEVILLNSGNFLVVWQDTAGDTGTSGSTPLVGIRGQLIDADGVKVGAEFTLNTTTVNAAQEDPAVAVTDTGFVASWVDRSGSGFIRAQFFDNTGAATSGEILVNFNAVANQLKPTATVLANGDVLFTWWDLSNAGGDPANGGIKGRLYSSAGNPLTNEFLMNTTVDRDQDAPRVVALADGGFVLVFEDRSEYMLGNIRAQQFDAAGNKVGGEWIATYGTSYAQKVPTIVQLENGDLAIAWYDGKNIGSNDPNGWEVMTRVLSPAVASGDVVANADSLVADTDVATTFAAADLLGNDTHTFGTLTIESVTAGSGGTVVLNPDGSVTFTSSAGFEGDATFTYVASDGEGGTSSATVTVDVSIPDLAPVHGLPATLGTAEDTPVALNGGLAVDPPPSWVSDADSATVTTTLSTASGTFSVTGSGTAVVTGDGTGTVTITGSVADVNLAVYHAWYNPVANVYGSREITVTTTDGNSSVASTIDVTISPARDAPEGAEVTHAATEDTAYTFHALDFGFSDVDGDSLAHIVLTSTPVHGRIVDLGGYELSEDITGDGIPDVFLSAPQRDLVAGDVLDPALMALGYIVYIPATDANGSAADSFTYQVVDNGNTPGTAGTVDLTPNTFTFDIAAVNDSPNLTAVANTVTIAEGDTALLDADVAFADPESNFDGGSLSVTGALAEDVLAIRSVGTDPGEIGLDGANVTYGGVVIGTFALVAGSAGGNDLAVTFNAAATAEAVEALIENLTYSNTSDTPMAARDLAVTVTDDLSESISRIVTVNVTAVNDAPGITLDYLEPTLATWTEGDGPVLLARGARLDDDNDAFDGAVLTIATDGATTGDQLAIQSNLDIEVSGSDVIYHDPIDGDQVVGTWSGGEDGAPLVVTFNAQACHCAVEATMASIQYQNTDDLTAAGTRTIDFTLVDGGGTALGGTDTGTDSVDLTVLPFASVIAGPAAVGDEDAAIALTGVVIDGLAADPASDVVVVRLQVEHGTLDIRDDVSGGLAAGGIVGNGTGTLVLTGTQDAINATLAAAGGLTYQGAAEFSGTDALAIDAHLDAPPVPFAFSSAGGSPIGSPIPALDLFDVDGDGIDDMMLGVAGMFAILSSTNGPVSGPLPGGGMPLDFVGGDFDGDGLVDVGFIAGTGSDNYLAYFSSDTGTIVHVADIGPAYDVVAGDFDGDGLTDLAVADPTNGVVVVALQDGLGGFVGSDAVVTGRAAYSLVAGDFNGDNVLDLVVGNAGTTPGPVAPGSVDLLLGNGDGTFQPASSLVTPAGAMVGEVVAADFNDDGALDFAFAYLTDNAGGPGGVQVVLGNGDGTFGTPAVHQTTAAGAPLRLVAGDFNGDGAIDLVVANRDVPGTFSVLGGNGDGTFAAPVAFGTADTPFELAAGDPDGDGDLDLILSALEGGGALALVNNDTDTVFHQIIGSKDITVNLVDDDAVAVDDGSVTVAEDALVTIDVLANDSDVDGPAPAIATVNGVTLAAGQSTTLASGAMVTLLADGRLTYDPNGQFHPLVSAATAAATGAGNASATDSFNYTLGGGAGATVTVTVLGVDGPGDELWGTPGIDEINGTAGNDVIRAFGNIDLVTGGAGDDVIYGNDDGDTLNGGADDDELRGGNGNDLLQGGDGEDVLVGNLGDDTMQGGLGDDTYYVGEAGDVVVENPGEGTDIVRTRIDYTLGDNVENLTLAGGARSGTGNGLGNRIFGSNGVDTLSGLGGDDILRGRDGRDAVLGGAGADVIDGGAGKDTLTGGANRDTFQFRDGDMGATRPLADVITDFSHADAERIQLNLVDADTTAGGNQAFAFLGTGTFTGTAGQLRYEVAGGNTWVSADTDGDGAADWYIGLTGVHALTAGDFVL